MATPDLTTLSQPVLDALSVAQSAKASADADNADAVAKAKAALDAAVASQAAAEKAKGSVAKLSSARQALDVAVDAFFQPGAIAQAPGV